ncbi:hypothetical protein C8J55DRAFT_602944 [Lentinula edodes]|uniref:Uncharacterized protein n=1 Tax=Lentinula lateritia TaxID=40482 RepID=A0A9W9AZH0_9AGAR|nr:hypothetical protein C8J55DRAFT_602944 [Lentinula edodes]
MFKNFSFKFKSRSLSLATCELLASLTFSRILILLSFRRHIMLFKASYLSIFASFLLATYAAPIHSLPIVHIKFYFANPDIAPPGTGSSLPWVKKTVKSVTDGIRLNNGAKAEWKPRYCNRLDHDGDELSFYYWGDGVGHDCKVEESSCFATGTQHGDEWHFEIYGSTNALLHHFSIPSFSSQHPQRPVHDIDHLDLHGIP